MPEGYCRNPVFIRYPFTPYFNAFTMYASSENVVKKIFASVCLFKNLFYPDRSCPFIRMSIRRTSGRVHHITGRHLFPSCPVPVTLLLLLLPELSLTHWIPGYRHLQLLSSSFSLIFRNRNKYTEAIFFLDLHGSAKHADTFFHILDPDSAAFCIFCFSSVFGLSGTFLLGIFFPVSIWPDPLI